MVVLIILASCGIGITGNFLPSNRESYLDNEIKMEQTGKKEDEDKKESNETKD